MQRHPKFTGLELIATDTQNRTLPYHDSETGNDVEFITNNFEISALEVANLYRHRWDIEVFFKWIKQNIVVKTLWGYSENAVRTHLWVAIITYLLIAKIKADYKSPYSITEVATLIRISALERVDLRCTPSIRQVVSL